MALRQQDDAPKWTAQGRQQARVLLIDDDRKHVRMLRQVIQPAVELLLVCSSCQEALEPLRQQEFDIILTSSDALLDEVTAEEFLQLSSRHCAQGRLLLHSERNHRERLATLLGEYGLMNLLARNAEVDREELLITLQKILTGDIFGLRKYFPWGAPSQNLQMSCSNDRRLALEQTRSFMGEEVGLRSRIVEQLATVVDELVSNAFYNAPIDADGSRPYAHLPRTEEVNLGSSENSELKMMSDGRRVGVAVSDPYGSLTASTVLDYLAKCFRKGSDQVDQKEGGAGLGLYYVFESVSQFIVNVAPGQRTELIGLVDVDISYREFVARCKSINIFVESRLLGDESSADLLP